MKLKHALLISFALVSYTVPGQADRTPPYEMISGDKPKTKNEGSLDVHKKELKTIGHETQDADAPTPRKRRKKRTADSKAKAPKVEPKSEGSAKTSVDLQWGEGEAKAEDK